LAEAVMVHARPDMPREGVEALIDDSIANKLY
jgi:hypothetical protein